MDDEQEALAKYKAALAETKAAIEADDRARDAVQIADRNKREAEAVRKAAFDHLQFAADCLQTVLVGKPLSYY